MKRFYCTILIWFVLSGTSEGSVMDPVFKNYLNSKKPQDEISVIIRFKDKTDLSRFKDKNRNTRRVKIFNEVKRKADISQTNARRFLANKTKKTRGLWMINALAVTASAEVINAVSYLPEIESITQDRFLNVSQTTASQPADPQWNLNIIGAPQMWQMGFDGQNIVVAVMDSGVDALHPDLSAQYRGGTNSWFDPHNQYSVPHDSQGHGTEVTGIIVGGNHSGAPIGVAPQAKWIAVKIFNNAGITTYSAIHAGFQWLLDPDSNPQTDDAPHIVNNSWGINDLFNTCVNEFQTDIAILKTAGIVVVFSAGNSGPNSNTSISPANYSQSFAVGSVEPSLAIEVSSSRGPSPCDDSIFPEVCAPGVQIKTSTLTFNGIFPNSYAYRSGSSFAVSHVAGAMALLLSAYPQSSPGDLEWAIAQSAVDLGDTGPDNNYGYGLIDITGAYNALFNLEHRRITSVICNDNDTITLQWSSFGNNYAYRIESAGNLEIPDWQTVNPVSEMIFNNSQWTANVNTDQGKNFFRIVGMRTKNY